MHVPEKLKESSIPNPSIEFYDRMPRNSCLSFSLVNGQKKKLLELVAPQGFQCHMPHVTVVFDSKGSGYSTHLDVLNLSK